MTARPVIIDTDPGIDDALAIALALASPELDVLAITTVGGNTGIAQTTRNALDIAALAGRPEIPIGAGASRPLVVRASASAETIHGADGLGGVRLPRAVRGPDPRGAIALMVEAIESAEAPVTAIAIGPLTNLAVLAAAHPATYAKLDRIVMMGGGARDLGNDSLAAEFNISYDPEAASRVFSSGVPIVMVGLDVTNRAITDSADLAPLRDGGPLSRVLSKMLDQYSHACQESFGDPTVRQHDPVAVAYVIDPTILGAEPFWVGIECRGELTRGMTVVDLRGFTRLPANAEVALSIDSRRFVELLQGRIPNL